jgi:hypothetical protein
MWNFQMLHTNSSDFWAPVSVWNPAEKRTYNFLDRTPNNNTQESVNIFGYDAATHSYVQDPRVDLAGKFGAPHVYGRWVLDIGRQKIYRPWRSLWVYDIPTKAWAVQSGATCPLGLDGYAMHEELGEVLAITAARNVVAWNPDTNVLRTLGPCGRVGRHSHAHYNPIRKEWFSSFGDTGRGLTIVDRNSNISTRVIPTTVGGLTVGGTSSGSFSFYDPISGNYLLYTRGTTRYLWEYSPDLDEWRLALTLSGTPANWPTYDGHLIAPIPEAGVIMWLHRSTVSSGKHQRLYKHASVF